MPAFTVDCSIIIPTRDQLHFLQPCIDSVLASEYSGSFEVIIVNNGSVEDETRVYLESLVRDMRVKVMDWPQPFNFSAINNAAARIASGEVLCFLNNDIKVLSRDWLEQLVPVARRYDVGAVGSLLLYPDRKVQHAGIVLDQARVACHAGAGESEDFLARASNAAFCLVDAVTAACLLTRRDQFLQFAGFDADNLAVSYNDVDYCLRLAAAGYPILLATQVKLLHYESVTRKSDSLPQNRPRAVKEKEYMDRRWQQRLAGHRYTSGLPATFRFLEQLPEEGSLVSLLSDTDRRSGRAVTAPQEQQARQPEVQQRFLEIQEQEMPKSATGIVHSGSHPGNLLHNILRQLRPAKQGLGRWLMGFALGRRLIALKNGKQNVKPAVSATPPSDSKAGYDRQASAQLEEFLASDERLQFPRVSTPRLSVILVFYNKVHLSLLCLQSLLRYAGADYEVVIIDNASSDATETLCQRIDNAIIERNAENLGFVDAVNQAAGLARGRTLLLLNNDATLRPQTIARALATLDSAADIAAVGGKILLLDGRLQEAGSIVWQDGSCSGYGRNQDPALPEYNFRREVDYCSGAFLMFDRAQFIAMGGFDRAYAPAYYEESDFCIRLKKAGYRIVYEPQAVIDHYEFASSGGFTGASQLQAAHRDVLCEKHREYLAGKQTNSAVHVARARTSNDFPNVLLIDDRVPHKDLGAGYPRCAELLVELSRLNLNVSFYPLLFPDESWDSTYATIPANIEVILHSGQDGLEAFLQQRQGSFDYLIVSRIHNMLDFNRILRRRPQLLQGCRLIYDAEAFTAPREIRRLEIMGKPVTPDKQQQMLREELEVAQQASRIITVSPRESRFYLDAGFPDVMVLGHASALSPTPAAFNARENLLFVGALRDDNSPNADSLLWFCNEVLPLIHAQLNTPLRLIVAGDNTAPQLGSIDRRYVQFTGRLDDLTHLYDHCRVFVAPTRFAAGIPRKVHDAAAHGLPAVTTGLLAEQLGWKNNQQLLCADTAQDFATQCCRLYADETLWNQLRREALSAVAADCSPEQFRSAVAQIFSDRP